MKSAATAARTASDVIITVLRSSDRGSRRPSGPASIAGTARDSITPLTTRPEWVVARARLKTAMLFEVVADLAHHLTRPGEPVVAVPAKEIEKSRHQATRLREARSRWSMLADASIITGRRNADWASFSHV